MENERIEDFLQCENCLGGREGTGVQRSVLANDFIVNSNIPGGIDGARPLQEIQFVSPFSVAMRFGIKFRLQNMLQISAGSPQNEDNIFTCILFGGIDAGGVPDGLVLPRLGTITT